ncbi:MAG: NAD(P)H-binding protein [Alphaproteobacteria bacterium]|nr:NAD(P)H-binding protein [Alphaproteobacteria bacterium]
MSQRRIVVLGATGLLGRRIVAHLVNAFQEARIVAASRHATLKAADFPEAVATVDIDLETSAGFGAAFTDATDLVIAVSGRPGRFDAIEHKGVVDAARMAIDNGVGLVVHISGTAAPQAPAWFEAGVAKKRAEAAIAALPAASIILRPSWLMESLPRFERSGGMTLFGSGQASIHWLALDDLAGVVVEVLGMPQPHSGFYPVLGPQAISLREAVSQYARAKGLSGVRALPMPVARLISVFAEGMRPVLQLVRVFERFDETTLEGVAVPFPQPRTTLEGWLKRS